MKKGVFGAWFKELATLIFTQTIQAFLLAIVMTIVISALSAAGTTDTGSYAAGLLAIIALSQFNKIERLVKSIFGVQSQYGGDMDSGKGGILAGMAAFTMGKKLTNNVGKVIGGTGSAIKSSFQIRSLKKQQGALSLSGAEDAEGAAASALDSMEGAADNFINNAATGAGMASGAQLVGGTGNNGMGTGVTAAQIDQLIQAVNKQTQAVEKNRADDNKSKLDEKMKALDEKIEDARKGRREALRTVESGIVETAAAPVGGAVGAIIGLGMGDDKLADNIITGAGAADMLAAKAVKVKGDLSEGARSVYKEIKPDSGKSRPKQVRINIERRDNAENDRKFYEEVTSQINKAMDQGSYRNTTKSTRETAVKNIKSAAKIKTNARPNIDASNMQ